MKSWIRWVKFLGCEFEDSRVEGNDFFVWSMVNGDDEGKRDFCVGELFVFGNRWES